MERNSRAEMSTKTMSTVPAGKLAMDLALFGEKQHRTDGAQIERFVTCIFAGDKPEANSGLFALFTAFVRSLAAKDCVEGADGEAVEACRKICDVMGWLPAEAV